jgi:hypothetical protein
MEKNDRYTSIIWTVFGLYIAFEGYRLKLGIISYPAPGFIIFWAGITLSVLSIVLFFNTFYYSKEEKILWKGFKWINAVKLMVSLIVYTLLFQWLGFILSTFCLLLFSFKTFGNLKWRLSFLLSFISIALTYSIFDLYFGFRFPQGILKEFKYFLN